MAAATFPLYWREAVANCLFSKTENFFHAIAVTVTDLLCDNLCIFVCLNQGRVLDKRRSLPQRKVQK